MRLFWITAVVLVVDQLTKALVLQQMYLGQSIPVLGDWLRLTFTENPGMAFGLTIGPPMMTTVFAILATGLILYYAWRIKGGYVPYRASLFLVLGGAIGNIIDRVFYGVFVYGQGLFTGKVVDFIHINLWRGHVPAEVPLLGGSYIALFPIWNVADMAIVCGVVGILLFQRRFHDQQEGTSAAAVAVVPAVPAAVPVAALAVEVESPMEPQGDGGGSGQ
jgi:signal peptidase II